LLSSVNDINDITQWMLMMMMVVMLCKEVNYVILFIYYKWVYMFMNYVKLYIHIL
jgi:hypothetical protein